MLVSGRKSTSYIFEGLDAVCGSRQALYSFLSRMFERELAEEIVKELQDFIEDLELSPRGAWTRALGWSPANAWQLPGCPHVPPLRALCLIGNGQL